MGTKSIKINFVCSVKREQRERERAEWESEHRSHRKAKSERKFVVRILHIANLMPKSKYKCFFLQRAYSIAPCIENTCGGIVFTPYICNLTPKLHIKHQPLHSYFIKMSVCVCEFMLYSHSKKRWVAKIKYIW